DRQSTNDLHAFIHEIKSRGDDIVEYAKNHGFHEVPDESGAHVDCQIIDTSMLNLEDLHPDLKIHLDVVKDSNPVILVMDYAFGTQAFELIDSLLQPMVMEGEEKNLNL
ncbi:MAG TPA: hypothetical protein DCE18_13880, partial [Syntrophobacteraceae bacterium]|nr:hypothetical protein [Syntrophobacteraceae bacterium]